MSLTFVTAGSRGDVQPLVALARGAQARGVVARVIANSEYEDLVRRNGLEYVGLPGQSPREIWADESRLSAKRSNGFRHFGTLARILRRRGPNRQSLSDIVEACKGSTAIVFSHASFNAFHVAEHLGVPAIAAYLYPTLSSSAYPAVLMPPGPMRNGYYNTATHFAVHQTFWMVDRSWVNRWRKGNLALRGLGIMPPLNTVVGRRVLNLHGFSPSVLPAPPDWPSPSFVTGYWFLDEGTDWTPPVALERFMAAGPPPVCVTFGSEMDSNPRDLYQTVYDAIERAGARAVLVTGWSDRQSLPQSDHVFVVDSAPYDWLFSQTSCVVHHAGTGTAAEVMRSGTPSVCIPFHGEQRFWAQAMWTIGVASEPIPRAGLTSEALAASLHAATSDSIRTRARSVGAEIRSEDGVGTAIRLIDAYLSGAAPESTSELSRA